MFLDPAVKQHSGSVAGDETPVTVEPQGRRGHGREPILVAPYNA